MSKNKFPFLNGIINLRNEAKLILHNTLLQTSAKEEALLTAFLAEEYQNESLEYPHTPPDFHPAAALWAAKITYTIAQLLLFRETPEEELPNILPPFVGPTTPATILSADLCLRFVPQIIGEAKAIDPGDPLLPLVEELLKKWHYSAIDFDLEEEQLSFDFLADSDCLQQLYVDRILTLKNKKRAERAAVKSLLLASLGNHSQIFWH